MNAAEHYLAGEEELGAAQALGNADDTWDSDQPDLAAEAQREIELRTAMALAHFEAARAAAELSLGLLGRDPGAQWEEAQNAAESVWRA